jgi:preprotein translocase subunit YajC
MNFSLLPVAYASTATGAATHGGEGLSSILLLVGFVLIFYFLLWRPQSKRMKEQKQLISSLAKGDEVITAGGILGKITKVTDDFLMLAVAEGIEITVQKSSVTTSLPKGTLKSV